MKLRGQWQTYRGIPLMPTYHPAYVLRNQALTADWIAPAPYDRQFRDTILAPPSRTHPLGTDDLGRDRLSRLLYGTRVSLVLAPAAALLASLLSGAAGVFAAWKGGLWRNGMEVSSDLFLSLPWMFLLLTVRAALPLNISPLASVALKNLSRSLTL